MRPSISKHLASACAGLALWGAARLGHAYITSAMLEYCADDEVAIYLNGSELMRRSEFGPFDYQVITTADGSLPLELFRENQENVLGVENFDTEAGAINVSYRLTVYHSDGDPVVIWSVPEQSKFLHLSKEEKSPLGWTEVNFDDSKWGQAVGVNPIGDWVQSARLEDPAFGNFLGPGPVPYLAHKPDSMCRGGDHNLFRSKFRFPNNPAKVEIAINPTKAVYGQPLSVRLIPGPDTTELSQFNMMAWLPKNVELTNYAPGASYDPNLRRIHWKTSNRDMKVSYAKLHASQVLSAGAWGAPEKVLGPPKKGHDRRNRNIPASIYNDGAVVNAGAAGWFKLDLPKVDFSQGTPLIQGVVFRNQMKMGARSASHERETDYMMFNYSVDGSNRGVLPDDVNVARTTWEHNWMDGYYHASEDRKWTWDDVRNLRVMYKVRQIGKRDKNLMASVTCIVRYYYPSKVAPWFQTKVLETKCADIKLETGVFRYGTKMTTSDPLVVKVNQHLCAPTPAPTPVPTPVPIMMAKPQPTSTPVPAGVQLKQQALGLGCLSVNPDPMDYSGAFIYFCLKVGAKVTVNIYDATTGAGVRRIEGTDFRAGDGQIYYNALGDDKKVIKPGRYILELVADKEGGKELRNSTFTVVKKKVKR